LCSLTSSDACAHQTQTVAIEVQKALAEARRGEAAAASAAAEAISASAATAASTREGELREASRQLAAAQAAVFALEARPGSAAQRRKRHRVSPNARPLSSPSADR
jgi:hypothetical protein